MKKIALVLVLFVLILSSCVPQSGDISEMSTAEEATIEPIIVPTMAPTDIKVLTFEPAAIVVENTSTAEPSSYEEILSCSEAVCQCASWSYRRVCNPPPNQDQCLNVGYCAESECTTACQPGFYPCNRVCCKYGVSP